MGIEIEEIEGQGNANTSAVATGGDRGHRMEDDVKGTWTHTHLVATTELVNERTDTRAEMGEEMIGLGTVIEVKGLAGEIETTGVCLDGMLGAMITIDLLGGSVIFSKDEWIEGLVDAVPHEAIEMNLHSRWVAEIERRARVHRQRRRSLLLI